MLSTCHEFKLLFYKLYLAQWKEDMCADEIVFILHKSVFLYKVNISSS